MEYLEGSLIFSNFGKGGNLREFIKQRKEMNQGITDHEKSVILKQIVEAIKYIHDHQIIHRDLKLENILLKNKNHINEVKIADFGISQRFDDNIGQINIHLLLFSIHSNSKAGGTRGFMPPEIFNGQSYGKSVDIWSCGIILFMLCSNGRHPFITHQERTNKERIEKLKNPKFQFYLESENKILNNKNSNNLSQKQKVMRLSMGNNNMNNNLLQQPQQIGALIKLRILSNFIDQSQAQIKTNRQSHQISKKAASISNPILETNQIIESHKSNSEIKENFTPLSIDLIKKMCAFGPSMRYSLIQILNHPWVTKQNSWQIPLTNNELFSSFEKTQKFIQIIIAQMIIEQIKQKSENKLDFFINLSNGIKESNNKFQIRKYKNKCSTTKNKLAQMFAPGQQKLQIFQRESFQQKQRNLIFQREYEVQIQKNKYCFQQQKNKSAVSFYFQKLLDSNIQSNINFAKVQLQKYCKKSLCNH